MSDGPRPRPAAAPAPRRLILSIEAATPMGGVALADVGGRLVALSARERGGALSPYLMPDVDRLCREENVGAGEIAAVAVSLGPGGFTGLRVGLALAKTLAQTWQARLYGFSTLACAARRWPIAGATVAILLDARRGEVYCGLYELDEQLQPRALCADAVVMIEQAMELINANAACDELVLTGDGSRIYRGTIEALLRSGLRPTFTQPPFDGPGADGLALLGAAALDRGEEGIDPLTAEPQYLRASDAAKRHPHWLNNAAVMASTGPVEQMT